MRRLVLGGLGGLGGMIALLWWLVGSGPAESKLDGETAHSRAITSGFRDALDNARRAGAGGSRLGTIKGGRQDGLVRITGNVVDRLSREPVGDVEVVFRGPDGEESVTAGADGSYRIELNPGAYRAFVRDDSVLSVGLPVEERLPGFPDLDAIGAPDETAMPLVVVQQDLEAVDLFVLRGGAIYGRVLDHAGKPVAHAVVRGVNSNRVRPLLGSDMAETDADGHYEIRLPAGDWTLDVNHVRYAGAANQVMVALDAGERVEADLSVTAGCVISGKVVDANNTPSNDGAIELQTGSSFFPAGKILANGTFRWTTILTGTEVVLRAWPWKSPHSQPLAFNCREGARYDNVVFQLPGRGPDLAGTLVDATGAPVPLAFIDLVPLDQGGISQQERASADGTWAVFAMPTGRYQVTGYAPGRGVVSAIVSSPQDQIRLQLGGTGRVEGTVIGIKHGTFELAISSCSVDGINVKIAEDSRLVSVRDGKFAIQDLPACTLSGEAKWGFETRGVDLGVEPGGSTTLALDFISHAGDDGETVLKMGELVDDDPTIN